MPCSRIIAAAFVTALATLTGGCGEDVTGTVGTGALEITLELSGSNVDPNGATVVLDGHERRLLLPGLPLTLFGLEPGNHSVWVTDLSGNCPAVNNPRPVAVVARQTTEARFAAVCEGPGARLDVSKTGLGMPPGHAETLDVLATDQTGAPEGWTAASSNGSIASVLVSGNKVTVTGVNVGGATITVTSLSGVVRSIPVQVYDPLVLDVGPLMIKVVDQFVFRAFDDNGTNFFGDGGRDTWWDPVVDTLAGWRALGSLWTPNRLANPSGTRWMLVVKAKDPTALAPPTTYVKEHAGWLTAGGNPMGSFWTPICPAGYVAMGTVMGPVQTNQNLPPSPNFATCVRRDLTVAATVDLSSGTSLNGHGAWRLTTPDLISPTAWLEAGTFVYQGIARSCTNATRFECEEPQSGHPVRNVLAVQLPVIIDAPSGSRVPMLTGYDQPPVQTTPIGTITMLAPFTALLGSTTFGGADVRYMVQNSPIVQVERVTYDRLMFHTVNFTSVRQENALQFLSGVSTTEQETYSHTAGISIAVETGVSFMGTGGKVTATVSYQFGYESMRGVTELRQQTTTVTIFTLPGKAAAAWQRRNVFVLKRHRQTAPGLYQLDNVGELEFGIDTWVVNEYPNER
jgi:hypothetical protein